MTASFDPTAHPKVCEGVLGPDGTLRGRARVTRTCVGLLLRVPAMSDSQTALERFLEQSETALEEYEQGYADADTTVRLLESYIADLREAVE